MTTTSALLILEPDPIQINVQVSEPKSFDLFLNNTFDFEITDFEFQNLTGFSFPNIVMPPNTIQSITFNVNRAESFFGTIPSKVRFNYYVDLPETIQSYHVNITGLGYKPDHLIVRAGDTVIWKNIDDISHTVTSSIFDFSLPVNQTASYVFTQLGELNYQDLVLFYPGTIEVINRTEPQKVHNPNYDITWHVNLNAILNPTTLNVSSIENSFEVSATGSTEDLIKIKNTGTEIAERINLSSSSKWISYDENKFNLGIGEVKYVRYTISPIIFDSNETNKTHNIDLRVKASNSEEHTLPISVYVPYSDIFSDFDSDEGFLIWFTTVFCPQHPNLFICNTSAGGGSGDSKVIYRDPEIPINLTEVEFYAMLKRIQRMEDTNQRTSNVLKQSMDIIKVWMEQQLGISNKSLETQLENEKKYKDRWDAVWIFGLCVLITGAIVVVVLSIRKYISKKKIMDVWRHKKY